jgi:hypothetical protein
VRIAESPARCRPWGTLRGRVDGLLRLLDAAVPTRRSLIPKFSKPGFHNEPQLKRGRSCSPNSCLLVIMKNHGFGLIQKLRRILRSVVRSHLINGNDCGARDLSAAARREEREYPDGSLNDEQRRRTAKDRATLWADLWRAAGFVIPRSQSALAMLSRRASPAARQKFSAAFPICEMVSRESNHRHNPLLINSLAAFNFRLPLEFPGEKLARSGAFSR